MEYPYKLHLNLFRLERDMPAAMLYRRPRVEGDMRPDDPNVLGGYSLPPTDSDAMNREGPWQKFWVSVSSNENYNPFTLSGSTNPDLAKRLLFFSLECAAKNLFRENQYEIRSQAFLPEIRFNMATFNEGFQQIAISPYYLKAQRAFGFVLDFHFRLREGIPFDRRVQQLSLSLDGGFKRNLDFLVDRLRFIRSFFDSEFSSIFPITLPGCDQSINIQKDFTPLQAEQLSGKTYLFAGEKPNRSQFVGVKEIGPLKQLKDRPNLVFIFKESDRVSARHFVKAFTGGDSKFDFPGFERLFKTGMDVDRNPIVVEDYGLAEMRRALSEIMRRDNAMPILVMKRDVDAYLCHKAIFSHAGIPTQVCTIDNIEDDYSLKWSIANIALQIFCKAGGQPWRVKPVDQDSLIIGISQSHKIVEIDGQPSVERFFAFSVLTDSSGLFKEIEVLANDSAQESYLSQLRQNLAKILAASASQFRRIVIHTTFKLREVELNSIKSAVKDASQDAAGECHFAVVKINQHCRFLATNRSVNSRVPYEGSYVKLSFNEYLIWFEGVFRDKPNVTKALPGPSHVQFLRGATDEEIDHRVVLQDLINLSGANWRGFNAKSTPVSVFYCHIVADLIHDFHTLGLPLPEFKDLNPWFL